MAMSLRSISRVLTPCLFLLAGVVTEMVEPKGAIAAEEIRLLVGGPLTLSVSVDSLETFAETGEVAEDMRLFTRFANEEALTGFRQALQSDIPLTVQQVDNLGYSDFGQDILSNVGKVIRPHPSLNGDRALRAAVIKAAATAREQETSWTPIDVLAEYPSKTIDVRLQDLQEIRRFMTAYVRYREQVMTAIRDRAALETSQVAANQSAIAQDLSAPGPYSFEKDRLVLSREAERQTRSGLQSRYSFEVDTYIPQGLSEPAPVVIVSHGFSDTKENFLNIGRHLASHGFVVLLPEHVGSDLDFRLKYTEGQLETAMSPSEFISRPEEVSYLIDWLESSVATSSGWAAQVDPSRIGIMGHSLGASTAYSLAGANLNFERIAASCEGSAIQINPAAYLQCQARFLPAQSYALEDPRIKAILSANGIGSVLYGPEDLSEVDVPILMAVAADDVVAPALIEQVQPFFQLGTDEKYLAVMSNASHFSFISPEDTEIVSPLTQPGAEAIANIVLGDYREIGAEYMEALNLAFWKVQLEGDLTYLPYLSDRYAQQLSADQTPKLTLVREFEPETLAKSGRPPISVFPRNDR